MNFRLTVLEYRINETVMKEKFSASIITKIKMFQVSGVKSTTLVWLALHPKDKKLIVNQALINI